MGGTGRLRRTPGTGTEYCGGATGGSGGPTGRGDDVGAGSGVGEATGADDRTGREGMGTDGAAAGLLPAGGLGLSGTPGVGEPGPFGVAAGTGGRRPAVGVARSAGGRCLRDPGGAAGGRATRTPGSSVGAAGSGSETGAGIAGCQPVGSTCGEGTTDGCGRSRQPPRGPGPSDEAGPPGRAGASSLSTPGCHSGVPASSTGC